MRPEAVLRLLSRYLRTGVLRVTDKLLISLVFAVMIVFICCRASSYEPLSVPEFRHLDALLQLRPPRAVDPSIALIAVDPVQLETFRQAKDRESHRGQREGTPVCTCATIGRDSIAKTISLLKQAKAKVVGLDLLFELPCPRHDPDLLRALNHTPTTDIVLVSGTTPTPGRYNFTDMPAFLALKEPPLVASPVLYNPHGVIRSVRLVQKDVPSPGEIELSRVRPPLAAAMYLASVGRAQELPEAQPDEVHEVTCGSLTVPVLPCEKVFLLWPLMSRESLPEPKHAMLINWAGPGFGHYPMYSMAALLKARPEQLKKWFSGKLVLIGSSGDRQFAPVGIGASRASWPLIDQTRELAMAGLEIHANALDTLLQGNFIRPLPVWLQWLMMLLSALLTLYAFRSMVTWRAVSLALVELIVIFICAAILIGYGYWSYSAIPAVCVFFAAICGAILGRSEARQAAEGLASDIEARDAVTTTLVHDLKQPLAAINILAQVLRTQQATAEGPAPELIEKIQEQVQVALGDIDELLVSDPARKIPLRLEKFDVAALARDLATAQSLQSKPHEVVVVAPEEGVWLQADPRYLGRALNNLMENAIKYWPAGGMVMVEIATDSDQATIRVIDKGIGIAPEDQSRLFGRFQRVIPDGVDIPGTGIGLFSVKRIIEAHGGTVAVFSAPGEGAVFSMKLPLAEQPAEQLARSSAR
jgi:signal transduction histidine kinase